ncbi:MAG: FAD-dependent oxidoreductase [Balneolaceae bacterium]|nr:FAD-dependent oxidoreductase [Balneolaceae bacterium]
MVIGIIGAGISGLTAGRLLAKAGHEVTIFEKSRGYGGRMATRYAGKDLNEKLDHGLPYFKAESAEFKEFAAELLEKNLIRVWGKNFSGFDGENLLNRNPNESNSTLFTSVNGMNAIGKYLGRWVDVRTNTRVGGLTYFGTNRTRKRSWMINLTSSEAVGVDAVIIAMPAPQAYGILNSTIDEVNTLKIVRKIDEVQYRPAFSLMAGYGDAPSPEWEGIVCVNSILDFISNERSKRDDAGETSFVIQANESFTRKHQKSDRETVIREMLGEFTKITGGFVSDAEWQQLHFWRYSRAKKVIGDHFYFELEDEDAPLALIGDYYKGNTIDNAYLSGYRLAKDWLKKFDK